MSKLVARYTENSDVFLNSHSEKELIERFGIFYETTVPVAAGTEIAANDNIQVAPFMPDYVRLAVDLAQRIDFVGTPQAWEALSAEQKAKFDSSTGASVLLAELPMNLVTD